MNALNIMSDINRKEVERTDTNNSTHSSRSNKVKLMIMAITMVILFPSKEDTIHVYTVTIFLNCLYCPPN